MHNMPAGQQAPAPAVSEEETRLQARMSLPGHPLSQTKPLLLGVVVHLGVVGRGL